MIAQLSGSIVEKLPGAVIVDVGGVGWEVAMSTASLAALPAEGDVVTIPTHLQVREDGMALFGFGSLREKALFALLIGVSGIGPKVALATLSALSPQALEEAIAREDAALIATTPGVGKKTAQRIIVELKDRIDLPDLGAAPTAVAVDAYSEATDALVGMGFSRAEAAQALADYAGGQGGAEDLVKYGLKRLGGPA
jgi:Holliday junction DNA helicase RuvA